MTTRDLRRSAALLALLLAAWPLADALARPGGGHSYSGGGSSYSGGRSSYSYRSSGSGGGGGGVGGAAYPIVMLTIITIGLISHGTRLASEKTQRWDSAPPARPPRADLGEVRIVDPDFSVVLFEDFVHALYARAHQARQSPEAMEALAPYVAPASRAALLRRDPAGVKIHGVVIGAMRPLRVTFPAAGETRVLVQLEFEANYSAELQHGAQGYYVHERWVLARDASARTRPPAQVLALNCPQCGAPFRSAGEGRCAHCGQQVDEGRFDWTVIHVLALNQEWRSPALTGDVAEQGTDLPTIVHPLLQSRLAELAAADPGVTPESITRRVQSIYAAMNSAWSARDLRPVRPFVSDAQYDALAYWVAAYRAQGLRNVLRDMSISRVDLARLERDKHFDAITVRVFASGFDSTVRDSDGRRVSGSDEHRRAYTEYWTLIRGAGVVGAARDPASCPNCGASLAHVNMAGHCEHCGAHMTRGEFDWVLSKIEQDEAYTG